MGATFNIVRLERFNKTVAIEVESVELILQLYTHV